MALTLADFLAQAIALEGEAAERYLELTRIMEEYDNTDTLAVFKEMYRLSQIHFEEVRARAGSTPLPKLNAWQYRWSIPSRIGGSEMDASMTPYEALRYARDNEVRAMEFYRAAAIEAEDAEVRRLAGEFAEEEAEHVAGLDTWISRTPRPIVTWREDPDLDKSRD